MTFRDLKILVGSVVLVLLLMVVTELIGDALVRPARYDAVASRIAAEDQAETAAPVKKAVVLEPVGPLLAQASVDDGARIFRKCAACHTSDKGGKNKLGPNLWNIVNAELGARAGFGYSAALKAKAGTWGFESLNAFIAKPRAAIRGTKMAFGGVAKPRDRANLIAFLRSLSDSPAPLP